MGYPAETYERELVPTLFAPWANRLLKLAPPRAGERILDLACGTGVVARRAAMLAGDALITGLDASPHMLDVARSAAEREQMRIGWEEGEAESLPFADQSFDLVLCQFALMFFNDPAAALIEMHRVLAEDGRLALSVWQGLDRHPFYQKLDATLQRRCGLSAVGDSFRLGDANELRRMLHNAGFHDLRLEPVSMPAHFPDPEGFLTGETAVSTAALSVVQELDEPARAGLLAAIRQDMSLALRDVTQDGHVVLPFHAYLVYAQA